VVHASELEGTLIVQSTLQVEEHPAAMALDTGRHLLAVVALPLPCGGRLLADVAHQEAQDSAGIASALRQIG